MATTTIPPGAVNRPSFTAVDHEFLEAPPSYDERLSLTLDELPARPAARPPRLRSLVIFAAIAGVTSLVLLLALLRLLGGVLFSS